METQEVCSKQGRRCSSVQLRCGAPTRSQAAGATVFQLQKPPLELPTVLVFRGEGDDAQGKYVKELDQALDSFRSADFVCAAEPLDPLTSKYPQAPITGTKRGERMGQPAIQSLVRRSR